MKLVVEFKVTHPVDDEKKEQFLSYSCLEVDPDFHRHQIDESAMNLKSRASFKGKEARTFEYP